MGIYNFITSSNSNEQIHLLAFTYEYLSRTFGIYFSDFVTKGFSNEKLGALLCGVWRSNSRV